MSSAMTEFKISTDLDAIRSQVIEANFDEVKAWLDENLEPYKNMTVTAEQIPVAKLYRANIRKVADRIDTSRKEAKAAALAAYSEFEQKCKTLTGMCAEAANAIDEQVKAFEAQEKEEKIALLRAIYDAGSEEVRAYLPWERVFNPKWENKGYSADLAKNEIADAFIGTGKDLETIRSVGGENTAYLLDYYRQTHDIGAVVRKNAELTAMKQAEEERRRQAEEMRQRLAERAAQAQAEKADSAPAPAPQTRLETAETEAEELVTMDFRVVCTKEKLNALAAFLRANGIRYGRVPK